MLITRTLGAAALVLALAAGQPSSAQSYIPVGTGGTVHRIVLPPVEQFKEGDIWNTEPIAAPGGKVSVVIPYQRVHGVWAQASLDINAMISGAQREFTSAPRDGFRYPAPVGEGQLFATPDGLLHRVIGGRWRDIPIGATLEVGDGRRVTIDRRLTQGEARQLQTIFDRVARRG